MVIPSIHNLLAKLDSTFNKDSTDTNFYQLLQLVAWELDATRRELKQTRNDNFFYQVRDDQLFSNLGVLLKINKQPFFTKRRIQNIPLNIKIEEDLTTKPKCLSEHLVKVTVQWQTELQCTSEIDYSDKSPYAIPLRNDPLTFLFDSVNATELKTIETNQGKNHTVIIPGLKFSDDLFFRVRFVNQVKETRQSDFIHIKLPDYPLLTPIVTTDAPTLQDIDGNDIQTPLDEDPFGFRQYRKILYGVLTSYLTGPTPKGVIAGVQPFYDFPVEIIENYKAIPNLYETNAIEVQDEILVHTFGVNIILNNNATPRNLGELNEQVQSVLEFIKPAHTLPKLQYVIPDHFFCPSDNPFGVKNKALELEPSIGPCGEKVYINPTSVDLGANSYYQDILGYKTYCDYAINYFTAYCPSNYYGYEISTKLHGYYDVLDRNYFYISKGQRVVICPFIQNPQIELLIEHRNSSAPLSIVIEGDVSAGPNTFTAIPYTSVVTVTLTPGNGPKTVTVTFNYAEQTKTNKTNLNQTLLGPGCHGSVSVDAVTYLLTTIPQECCVEEYILDETTFEPHVIINEENVFSQSYGFKLNDNESALNGVRQLMPHIVDQSRRDTDQALLTNIFSRTLNDTETLLFPEKQQQIADIHLDLDACDRFGYNFLVLNAVVPQKNTYCDEPRVLNRSLTYYPEVDFLANSGSVTVTEYRADKAFLLNGTEAYNTNNKHFNISLTNDIHGPVMAPIERFDLESWNPRIIDDNVCKVEKPKKLAC